MTDARTPAEQPDPTAAPPADHRDGPPPPASEWVHDHEPPADEAEREVQATIRSVSRLEESN
jgi:hypothetical protein